ncbi:MAG: hypothetical protein ACRYGK_03285 [Janthinobacterium lividum]
MVNNVAGSLGLNPLSLLQRSSETNEAKKESDAALPHHSALPSIGSFFKKGGTLALLAAAQINGAHASPTSANFNGNIDADGAVNNGTDLSHPAQPSSAVAVSTTLVPKTTLTASNHLSAEDIHSLTTFTAVAPSTTEVMQIEARNAKAFSDIAKAFKQMDKLVDRLEDMIDDFSDTSDDVDDQLNNIVEQQLPAELEKLQGSVSHDQLTGVVLNLMNKNDTLKNLSEGDKKEIAEAIAAEIIEFTDPGQTGASNSLAANKGLLLGGIALAGLAINL